MKSSKKAYLEFNYKVCLRAINVQIVTTLDKVKHNKVFRISGIKQDDLSAKLIDMGLYPGKEVSLLFAAPLGDPLAVDVDGYTLSLRKVEASLIELE